MQMPELAAAGGVGQFGHPSVHPDTYIKVLRPRGVKVAQMGLEMGDASQGRASAFVPSSPALLFHVDGAEVSLGVPRGLPAAGRGRAAEQLTWAKPCSCVRLQEGQVRWDLSGYEEQSL